jgi:hypothetical protein
MWESEVLLVPCEQLIVESLRNGFRDTNNCDYFLDFFLFILLVSNLLYLHWKVIEYRRLKTIN